MPAAQAEKSSTRGSYRPLLQRHHFNLQTIPLRELPYLAPRGTAKQTVRPRRTIPIVSDRILRSCPPNSVDDSA